MARFTALFGQRFSWQRDGMDAVAAALATDAGCHLRSQVGNIDVLELLYRGKPYPPGAHGARSRYVLRPQLSLPAMESQALHQNSRLGLPEHLRRGA